MSEYNGHLNKKAVALRYDTKNPAPIIVASGMGHMAEKIVEVAGENNVPVYEDNSLATILTQLELGAEIPEELYKAVVDIYVFFLSFKPDNVDLGEKQETQNQQEQQELPNQEEV